MRWVEINDEMHPRHGRPAAKINSKTRLVAVGYASNAVGTINPSKKSYNSRRKPERSPTSTPSTTRRTGRSTSSPRLRFPGLLDLQIFRPPHGRALRQARTPQAPSTLQSPPQHQRNSELLGVGHLEPRVHRGNRRLRGIPRRPGPSRPPRESKTRRAAIEPAYEAIHEHERVLLERIIAGLKKIPGPKIYGITDPARFNQRCATLAVRMKVTRPSNSPAASATAASSPGMATTTPSI